MTETAYKNIGRPDPNDWQNTFVLQRTQSTKTTNLIEPDLADEFSIANSTGFVMRSPLFVTKNIYWETS